MKLDFISQKYKKVVNAVDSYLNTPGKVRADFKVMPLTEFRQMGFKLERFNKIITALPDGVWIAGGFLRAIIAGEDELDGDIDFYFRNQDSLAALVDLIKYPLNESAKRAFNFYTIENKKGLIECKSDVTYRPDLQLISMIWYKTPLDVIKEFDFTVCQFAADKDNLYYNSYGWNDIRTRTISIYKHQDAINLLNRILKYKEKGYKIDVEHFQEIVNIARTTHPAENSFNRAKQIYDALPNRALNFLNNLAD